MQQNEDAMKQQQNEIEDLKRKLRLKDEAEAKVNSFHPYCFCLSKHLSNAQTIIDEANKFTN
jgi:hypothetical protein